MMHGQHSRREISPRLAALCGFACGLGVVGVGLLCRYGWALVSSLT